MYNKKTVLKTEELGIGYKGDLLIGGLGLTLSEGEVTALVGGNGIGKSTLLKTLTGELRPIEGKVFLSGKDLRRYSSKELARELSIVTTSTMLAGGLKVREVVGMGRHPHTGMFGFMRDEDKKMVEEAMERVGISYKADSYISELSDGERQKTMIARAIAQNTPVIILDEPFSFLDVAARIEILSLLKTIAEESGKTVLFSTHDVSQALRMCDRIWMVTPDRHITDTTPKEAVESGMIGQLFDNANVEFDKSQMDFVRKGSVFRNDI